MFVFTFSDIVDMIVIGIVVILALFITGFYVFIKMRDFVEDRKKHKYLTQHGYTRKNLLGTRFFIYCNDHTSDTIDCALFHEYMDKLKDHVRNIENNKD